MESDRTGTTDPVVRLMQERKLDEEDFEIQLHEARRSFALGYYAAARAELRGAIFVLDQIERRRCG